MIKKIISNKYIFSLITKILLVFLGIFSSAFINRYLGPTLKGEYAYILNIINLIVLILNLGIYQSYPFYKRKSIENIKQKYFIIFVLQFIFYLLIAIMLSILLANDNIYYFIFTLIPFMILSNQLTFLSMIENINLKNKISIGNQVFYTLILLIIFLFTQQNILYLIAILYLKEIALIIRTITKFDLKFDLSCINVYLIKNSISFGLFPMLTMLLINMNYKFDVIILNLFVDFEQIGYYTVGTGLASIIWIIPDAAKEVLFSKTTKKDSIEDITLSIKINLYISLLIVLMIIILGKLLIMVLYGTEFLNAYMVTVILFLGIIPMIFYKLIYTLFLAKGKQKISFNILLISVLLNIASNFFFIPTYGITGAAIASVMSYTVCGGCFLYIFMRDFNIRLRDVVILNKGEFEKLKIYKVNKVE